MAESTTKNNLGVDNQFIEEEQSPFFEKYNAISN